MKIGWTQIVNGLADQQKTVNVWFVEARVWKAVMLSIIALLLSKAFFMQVVTGGASMVWSEGNRLEVRRIVAARGVIEDREGKVLARNSVGGEGKVMREYPQGQVLAHTIGVVGEMSEKELEACRGGAGCFPGRVIGKSGLEKYYQDELSGVDGEEIVEVDARGEVQRIVARKESIPGKTVVTNLDIDLTREVIKVMEGREAEKEQKIMGAVVVSTVGGKVLSLVSWPMYDNGVFSSGDKEALSKLLNDEKYKPMFNRAIGGAYPPGSVYKLVTAMAGLEVGVVDGGTKIEDVGELKVGEYRYGSWNFDQYGKREGEMDLIKGLARSNDIFFYRLGEWMGEDKLISWSEKLGLGKLTGIDVAGEVTGMVPDTLERERRRGERWFLGNTYHLAIGQGDLLTTPLQVNRMTAEVILGKSCTPRIKAGKNECNELGLGLDHRGLVLEGMKAVCSSGGTAFEFFDLKVPVACKTGTAQQGGEDALPHAWMTAVIPKPNMRDELAAYEEGVVVTVLVEEAGEGSYEAAPIARKVTDYLISEAGRELFD